MLRIITLLPALLLISCGTARLYDGPQLLREQVVKIKSNGGTILVNGKSSGFWNNEFEALPGTYKIDCSNTLEERPYSCYTSTRFNSYSYNDCYSDRSKEIEKNGYSNKTCDSCEFEETYQTCSVPVFNIRCTTDIPMTAGKDYVVSCYASKTYMRSRGSSSYDYEGEMILGGNRIPADCDVDGPNMTEKEFSCGSGCGYHTCPN